MDIQEMLELLEGQDFASQYTILSGFSTFYHWLSRDAYVDQLIELASLSPNIAATIFDRFRRLLQDEPRLGDASDWYMAALAYLYILSQADQPILTQVAVTKALAVPEDFWLRRMAQKIAAEMQTSIQAT